jgi:hypothetical protein
MTQKMFLNIKALHAIALYSDCIREMKNYLEIPSTMPLHIASGNDFRYATQEELRELAWLSLPVPFPPYGSSGFKRMTVPIFIRKWALQLPAETFVFILSHEMAHVLLYATANPYCESEIATDIFAALILGFEILAKGRKVCVDNLVRRDYPGTNKEAFGYLNDEQFNLIAKHVQREYPDRY